MSHFYFQTRYFLLFLTVYFIGEYTYLINGDGCLPPPMAPPNPSPYSYGCGGGSSNFNPSAPSSSQTNLGYSQNYYPTSDVNRYQSFSNDNEDTEGDDNCDDSVTPGKTYVIEEVVQTDPTVGQLLVPDHYPNSMLLRFTGFYYLDALLMISLVFYMFHRIIDVGIIGIWHHFLSLFSNEDGGLLFMIIWIYVTVYLFRYFGRLFLWTLGRVLRFLYDRSQNVQNS